MDDCINKLNQVALGYNTKLKEAIYGLKARFVDIEVVYIDIYESLLDIMRNPLNSGKSYNDKSLVDSSYFILFF